MRIEIDYGPMPMDEIRDSCRLYTRELTVGWIVFCTLMGLATVGLSWAGHVFDVSWVLAWGAGLFCGGCWALGFCLFFLPVFWLPKSSAKSYAETGEVHIVIDDTGIYETAGAARTFHGWEAVKTVKQDKKGLNIHFKGGPFVYVSKKLLSDAELEDLLKQIAVLP